MNRRTTKFALMFFLLLSCANCTLRQKPPSQAATVSDNVDKRLQVIEQQIADLRAQLDAAIKRRDEVASTIDLQKRQEIARRKKQLESNTPSTQPVSPTDRAEVDKRKAQLQKFDTEDDDIDRQVKEIEEKNQQLKAEQKNQ